MLEEGAGELLKCSRQQYMYIYKANVFFGGSLATDHSILDNNKFYKKNSVYKTDL